MKKLVYYIGILVCTGIFLSSCIREDFSECEMGAVLPEGMIAPSFILVPYEGNNIINDSLYTAKMCAYDEQGKFINTYHISGKPQLNKIYTPDWGLPPGTYHFIVWINHHDMQSDECVIGESLRQHTKLQLAIPGTGIIDHPGKIPFLCYGNLDNEKLDSARNLITIPVMQLTNRINLRVTGLSNALLRADGHEYEFSITDNNGIYGYDGEFVTHDPFTYSTAKQVQSDTLDAALTVLKLSGAKTTPTLAIKNRTAGVQIYPVDNQNNNLIQWILSSNPDNNFDTTHVYNIRIDFGNEKEIPVTVTINDWVVDLSDYELNIN